jgi:hypothetical protein
VNGATSSASVLGIKRIHRTTALRKARTKQIADMIRNSFVRLAIQIAVSAPSARTEKSCYIETHATALHSLYERDGMSVIVRGCA